MARLLPQIAECARGESNKDEAGATQAKQQAADAFDSK